MQSRDYYDILGIPQSASKREVQSAYRQLARKFHPDVTGGNKKDEERFKAVNEANDILSDPAKRSAYDKWGDNWKHAEELEAAQQDTFGQASHRFSRANTPFSRGHTFQSDGFDDVFQRLFRDADQAHQQRPQRSRGQDIEQSVAVTLAEAQVGTTRTVQIQAQSPCATCKGEGRIGDVTCHTCNGRRHSAVLKQLEVTILPGVDNGTRIRLRRKGASGSGGGPAGDAIMVINVTNDPRFTRRGSSLHIDVPVPVTTAVLGGKVRIPTVTGELDLTIPEATQNGRVFRLTGQGMPLIKKENSYGDLFAKIRVVLPEILSDTQRTIYKRLQDIHESGTDLDSTDVGGN